MFTPENIKKLTNVSIVTYKTSDTKFEVAIYPNTLFDYKKGLVNKDKILHTDTVFIDVKKGKIASQQMLKTHFKNKPKGEIIDIILNNGSEKINDKSRNLEIERKENEICAIIANKMLFKNKKLNLATAKQLLKSIEYSVDYKKSAKVQANEICKVLALRPDCEIIKIKVQFENGKIVEMDGVEFATKKDEWKHNNIHFTIKYDEEVEEEEIC